MATDLVSGPTRTCMREISVRCCKAMTRARSTRSAAPASTGPMYCSSCSVTRQYCSVARPTGPGARGQGSTRCGSRGTFSASGASGRRAPAAPGAAGSRTRCGPRAGCRTSCGRACVRPARGSMRWPLNMHLACNETAPRKWTRSWNRTVDSLLGRTSQPAGHRCGRWPSTKGTYSAPLGVPRCAVGRLRAPSWLVAPARRSRTSNAAPRPFGARPELSRQRPRR